MSQPVTPAFSAIVRTVFTAVKGLNSYNTHMHHTAVS